MSEIVIDSSRFNKRIKKLLDSWKDSKNEFSKFEDLDAIILLPGDQKDEEPYTKTKALQNWLFGYEFPRTLMVFTKTTLYFAASSKKAQILEGIKPQGELKIKVFKVGKLPKENEPILESILENISKLKSTPKIGKFLKEKPQGKFVDEWENCIKKINFRAEDIDISPGVGAVLSLRDSNEMESVRFACDVSSKIMSEYFIDTMADFVGSGVDITHDQFSEKIGDALWDPKVRRKAKIPEKATEDDTEWCFNPIVQSGGAYNLSVSAVSDEQNLHPGVIICSLGIRYQTYCSVIARTFLIDSNKDQEKNYLFLIKLQKHVLSCIKPDVQFSKVYNDAVQYIEEKRPDLRDHFVKNIGFVTGIEFRDSTFVLSPKCKEVVKEGMVICSSLGFQKLVNPKPDNSKNKNYALLVSDNVIVKSDGCEEDKNENSKSQKNGSRDNDKKGSNGRTSTRKSAVLASKFRSENAEEEESQLAKRRKHQKELAEKLNSEGIRRFAAQEGDGDAQEQHALKKFESYKRETALPREVGRLKIVVDERADSIILPINGLAVPFHISTLKNISKNDEGDYIYLRLNFVSPGMGTSKKDNLSIADPESSFVRSLTYRSTDVVHLTNVFQTVSNLKKDQAKRELEKAQMADIVQQDKLQEIRGSRPTRLNDVFVRPGPDNKRVPGNLEIHRNGLRYLHPLKHENRIEATDASFDETGNRKRRYRYGDEDELEAEQEERIRRDRLDKEFKSFAEKISVESNHVIEMDVPFYEAGFYGVPFRSRVLLQPTVDCLVHLSDTPFFVVSISEIELAHLERVQFGLKNFDIVLVFKNYKKTPIHINTVPMEQVDDVKEWLDSVNIPFTEGPVNLNWTQIMKTINEDPVGFFEDGGWSFLQESSDNETGDSDNEESEFEISEEELEMSSEASDESEFDSESSSGSDESVSEGEDWDELEKKAKQYDERNTGVHHEENEGRSRGAQRVNRGGSSKRMRR
ncbi:hypothetical protein BB559_000235 [Furculomyces boomerangus]|uniref:FACT complex subunit n=1 Tax=Furculomyces boomerangus TaxID=61424 RepID=A0A2T9Z5V6_9FUNG|nr:hypothetical protein BB559_000235 [Furculomyces boomerangus]